MSKVGKAVLRRGWGGARARSMFCLWFLAAWAAAQSGGELRFCLRSEPKTFDPLKVEDDASVAIRYLTGGVLVRMNRQTQVLEPEHQRLYAHAISLGQGRNHFLIIKI